MHWNPAVGIPLFFVGLVVLALVWLFGKPRRPAQGRRQPVADGGTRPHRREPTLGDAPEADDPAPQAVAAPAVAADREPVQASFLDPVEAAGTAPVAGPSVTASGGPSIHSAMGRRPEGMPMERIVALHVVAAGSGRFEGADLVVAADKAGLEFGHKGIFHRLLEGKPDRGPVFSVANMLQPGSFDLSHVAELSTTGLSFFMALPGPIPALDAWDAMLPTAQRMAELLGGQVLDDEHNALGRQRIAHIRDELRAWDRAHPAESLSGAS